MYRRSWCPRQRRLAMNDAVLNKLERRLGRLRARLRLGIETDHEAQIFGQRVWRRARSMRPPKKRDLLAVYALSPTPNARISELTEFRNDRAARGVVDLAQRGAVNLMPIVSTCTSPGSADFRISHSSGRPLPLPRRARLSRWSRSNSSASPLEQRTALRQASRNGPRRIRSRSN